MSRTRSTLLTLLEALLLPLGGAQARSGCPLDLTCIDDARQAYDRALTLSDRYGSDAVLVVTDVDDTLPRSLLARTGWSFRALVFLDDQPANVRAMAEAFPTGGGVELHAFVYAREGPWETETASAEARLTASTAWQCLAATLVEVFPSRLGLPPAKAVPAGGD